MGSGGGGGGRGGWRRGAAFVFGEGAQDGVGIFEEGDEAESDVAVLRAAEAREQAGLFAHVGDDNQRPIGGVWRFHAAKV